MGVYIKDMQMPKEGYIDVRIKCNGTASFAIADNPYFKVVEAVPVPPHGRLIDADVLCKVLQKNSEDEWNNKTAPFSWTYAYDCVKDTVEIMPTIIPAEEAAQDAGDGP